MKILLLILLSIPSFAGISDYDSAFSEYKETAKETAETYRYTSKAYVHLRNTLVTEEFRKKISEIEQSLKENTKSTIKFVQDYLDSRENKVLLDDDLVMRIALLYYKNSNYNLQQAMDKYHDQLSSYYSGRTKVSPQIPVPNFSKTQEYCDRLLKDFPKSEFASYATYLKAVIDEENGKYESAKSLYEKIVTNYPYSKHRLESIWRFAELSFDFGNYKIAESSYRDVIALNNPNYTNKARYKLGSIKYTEKQFKEAKVVFTELLTALEKSSNSSLNRNLRKEVYEYLGLLHVQGVKIDDLPENVELESLQAVAKRLERHNQYSFARSIYKNYITKNYYNPQVPAYYALLIESLEGDTKIKESIAYREKLLKHVNPRGKWWKVNSHGDARFVSQESAETNKLFLARYYAQQGFENSSKKDLLRSRVAYKKFTKEEVYSDELSSAYFELGQVEDELKMFKASIASYSKALSLGLKGEDRRTAAYNQFFATKNSLNYNLPSFGTEILVRKKSKLNKKEKKLVSAFNALNPEWKETDDELPVLYFITQIYLSNSDLTSSLKFLDSILEKDNIGAQQISYVEDSAKWLVEIHSKNKDWDSVAKVNDKMKSMGAVSQMKQSKLAQLRFNNSVLSEAEIQEERGNLSGAALSFLNFAINNPKNYESDRARFKAAQLFRDSGNYQKSNDILKKIFNTEYRKDVLRMYTQNLLDSFQFSEANDFVKGLARADIVADPSLKNISKLNRFLKPDLEISKKFWNRYKSTKKFEYGFQAFKESVYSRDTKNIQTYKKVLAKNTKDPQVKLALNLLENWYAGDQEVALSACAEYRTNYVKRKRVTASQQNVYYQCQVFSEYSKSGSVSSELVEELATEKAHEAEILAEFYNSGAVESELSRLYQKSVKNALAISNFIEWNRNQKGFYSFKKYEIFPFQIMRSEAIPWRKLVKGDKEFNIESYCYRKGFGSCYRALKKSNAKKQQKDFDLLVKIALVLDNDKDAKAWAQEWLKASEDVEKIEITSLIEKINLSNTSMSEKKIIDDIYMGNSSENDYFQLSQHYFLNGDLRKASYVLNTAQRRFKDNSILQSSVEFLTGNSEVMEIEKSGDPRLWYINNLAGTNKQQEYISRKRLHSGSEWVKSLRISKALLTNGKLPNSAKSGSAYYHMLSSYSEYKKGNVGAIDSNLSIAKELGGKPMFDPSRDMERGVASEEN